MPSVVVVVVGGDESCVHRDRFAVPAGAVVIAADSGLDAAAAAGLTAHHVVGDLDSVRPATLAAAEAMGATVHRHPRDKDATDSELAFALALELLAVAAGSAAPSHPLPALVVLGGGGGRLDHLLADVLALAGPALAPVEVTARLGPATLTVVRPGRPRVVAGRIGEQLSLLPVHGRARGVTTAGLRWPLDDADLGAGTTRAVSNELVAATARVELASGVLVVVQPGTTARPVPLRSTPYDPHPVDPSVDAQPPWP
ncbi:MAG: thiamine pyrophosphokinae [Acidimicrobiales bacterium]|nr:thiamine pyrophosphokinae [Acidimicrobiales bacterium]